MVTAEELTVAIKSVGVSDTRDDLQEIEDGMEDTAESASDSAEELEGFSQRFSGALSAAVAGFSVGVGALLSSIPVLGESMSGLFAIFEALGFQIDRLARRLGAGGISDRLFDVADAIFELDGLAGDLVAVLGVLAAGVIGAAIGLATWAIKAKGMIGAAKGLIAVVKIIGGVLAGLVAGITATTAALAIAVAAVIAFAVAYLTNFRGVRDSTNEIIGDIWNFFVELASDLSNWAGDLASDAFEWGRNLIDRFIDGIRAAIGRLREFLGDLRDIGANVGISVPDLGGLGGGGGGNGGGASSRPRFRESRGGGSGGSQIDGRQITESTGRYRSGSPNRRGL